MLVQSSHQSLFVAAGMALALLGGSAAAGKEVTVIAEAIPDDAISTRVSFASHGQFAECRNFALAGARPQMDRAILRARQIAATGTSSIAPVAIVIAVPSR